MVVLVVVAASCERGTPVHTSPYATPAAYLCLVGAAGSLKFRKESKNTFLDSQNEKFLGVKNISFVLHDLNPLWTAMEVRCCGVWLTLFIRRIHYLAL